MANNECHFVGQNHAWILRVLCRTWHGTDGRRPSLSLGPIYINSFKLASKMATKLSLQSLLEFTGVGNRKLKDMVLVSRNVKELILVPECEGTDRNLYCVHKKNEPFEI